MPSIISKQFYSEPISLGLYYERDVLVSLVLGNMDLTAVKPKVPGFGKVYFEDKLATLKDACTQLHEDDNRKQVCLIYHLIANYWSHSCKCSM